jgi:hypothetical protein
VTGAAKADETQHRLAYATWLLGLVAKKTVIRPHHPVQLVLPVRVARRIKDFVADMERES